MKFTENKQPPTFKDGLKGLQTQVTKCQNGVQLFLPINLLHSFLQEEIKKIQQQKTAENTFLNKESGIKCRKEK